MCIACLRTLVLVSSVSSETVRSDKSDRFGVDSQLQYPLFHSSLRLRTEGLTCSLLHKIHVSNKSKYKTPSKDLRRTCTLEYRQREHRAGDDGQAPEERDEGRDGTGFALSASEREIGEQAEAAQEEPEEDDDDGNSDAGPG